MQLSDRIPSVSPGLSYQQDRYSSRLPAVVLLALVIASVPIVVCMPLTSDTVLFDLQAQTVQDGGVLYRDILEPNLPGVVWIHLLLRTMAGWSSEAMRTADLLIVAAACFLLCRLALSNPLPTHGSLGASSQISMRYRICLPLLFMGLFYLSRNEWCHCQRDSWMLLPVALALTVRTAAFSGTPQKFRNVLRLAEGFLWGISFWIKPHIAISVVTLFVLEILTSRTRRTAFREISLVICGGLLAAVPGIFWLVHTNAWSPFLEMQLEWNPEYLQAGRERRTWTRVWYMLIRFHPWWMIHCLAVPCALSRIRAGLIRRSSSAFGSDDLLTSLQIPAVYLSWLGQACLLQHAMDYIQVPPVILGISVLAAGMPAIPATLKRAVLAASVCLAMMLSPQLWPERLSHWFDCFREGSSWSMKTRLAQGRFPDWENLQPVVDFLADQDVTTGDVTCFTVHSIHVYDALRIRPSTRYIGISVLLELFPARRDEIAETVETSGHRYIVTDSDEAKMNSEQFPWNLPVVFHSGSFRVHRAAGPGDVSRAAAAMEQLQ